MVRWWHGGLGIAAGLSLLALAGTAQEKSSPGKPPPPPNDLPLVERLLAARKEYQHTLEDLREHYKKVGDPERQRWVEEELLSFHRIAKHAYRLDLDVPSEALKPEYNIPEAHDLYIRAKKYKERGWGTEHEDNLRRAEILLQELLTNYPQSLDIDDAAFHLGEIYESPTFKMFRRAALYYERAFQWNPNTTYPARMRAARLYDLKLQERSKAIKIYREITSHDGDTKQIDEAKKRLTELSSSPP